MTPDTAALRALVDTYVTGWYLTAAEIRALCDAADEVERLRGEVASLKAQQSELVLEVGDLTRSEQAYYDRAVTAEAERDASRTAHAALVAALRDAQAVIAAYEEDADAALTEKAEAVEAESQIADGFKARAEKAEAQVVAVLALHAPHGRLDDLHCAQHDPGSYPCATARAAGAS